MSPETSPVHSNKFDFSDHDETTFSCQVAVDGQMTTSEINAAIQALRGANQLDAEG